MKCALPGCHKPGVAGDAFCSRAHARLHYCGNDEQSSAGSLELGKGGGMARLNAGVLDPVTPLMQEAAARDLEARERVARENKRAALARANHARMELARRRAADAARVEERKLWRDYLDGAA